MNTCYFCKQKYEGYVVILKDYIESFAMAQHIKDLYYDREQKIGVCKACRKKHITDSPIEMIRHWLTVKMQLMIIESDLKDKNSKKKYAAAIKRVEEYEAKLEKTPEVQEMYFKNNPADFLNKLDYYNWDLHAVSKDYSPDDPKYKIFKRIVSFDHSKAKKCAFCGENKSQIWINNPNEEEGECWKVCIPCKKIIETAQDMGPVAVAMDIMQKHGMQPGYEAANKRYEELQQRMQDIAREDGQVLASFSIKRDS